MRSPRVQGAPEAAAAAAPAATTAVVGRDAGFPVAAELLLEVESARASGVLPAAPMSIQAEMEAERLA